MIRSLFKDVPRVLDRIRVSGGAGRAKFRGIRLPDGSPVPVEVVMEQFQVSREAAEKIAARMTR